MEADAGESLTDASAQACMQKVENLRKDPAAPLTPSALLTSHSDTPKGAFGRQPQDHVVVALARTVHARPREEVHLNVVCSAVSSEQGAVSVDPSLDVHSKSAEKKTCGKHAKAVTE